MSNTPWRKERRTITCCNGCMPPKRYPGCGADCKEYKEQKAKHLADKELEKAHTKKYPVLSNYDFNKL